MNPERGTCTRPPTGWWCSLDEGHDGPCPTRSERDRPYTSEDFYNPRHGRKRPPAVHQMWGVRFMLIVMGVAVGATAGLVLWLTLGAMAAR